MESPLSPADLEALALATQPSRAKSDEADRLARQRAAWRNRPGSRESMQPWAREIPDEDDVNPPST